MKNFSKLFLLLTVLAPKVYGLATPTTRYLTVEEEQAIEDDLEESIIDLDLIDGTLILSSHRGGNGGDSIASQFNVVANNLAQAWNALCLEGPYDLCREQGSFSSRLNNKNSNFVKVLSAPFVMAYDGAEREAINDVTKKGHPYIIVSENKWDDIQGDETYGASRKINLILHEYFSLMGLESSDYYMVSSALSSHLKARNFDLEKIANDTLLPKTCSISVQANGSLDDYQLGKIQENLTTLGYEAGAEGWTRFNLEASSQCEGALEQECSVKLEIVDTYKKVNSRPFFKIEKAVKGFDEMKLVRTAFSRITARLPQCN